MTEFTSNPQSDGSIWERHYSVEDSAFYLYNPFTNDCIWENYQQLHVEDCAEESFQPLEMRSFSSNVSLRSGINDPQLSVIDRSNIMVESKKLKIAKLQEQKMIQELQNVQSQPTISRKSQLLNRSVEDMYSWEEQRKIRLQQQVNLRKLEQSAEITGKPTITKKAELLSSHTNKGDVVERLRQYEENKLAKLKKLRTEEMEQSRFLSIPKISARSTQLARKELTIQDEDSASHTSRLYALSKLQTATHEFLHDGRLETHDEYTGQRLFAPVLNRTSEKLASRSRSSGSRVEDLLQEKGKLYKASLQEKERKKLIQEHQMSEIKKVNLVSEKIVQQKALVTGETANERLQRPIGKLKQKTLEGIDQPTFQPQIAEHTDKILAQSGYGHSYFPQHKENYNYDFADGEGAVCVDGNEITLLPRDATTNNKPSSGEDSLYYRFTMWDEQRKRRLELDRLHKQRLEMSECSFRPKISSLSNGPYRRDKHIESQSDISGRHYEWMNRRDEKIAKERQKQMESQLRDCTFVPKVPLPHAYKDNVNSGNSSLRALPSRSDGINEERMAHGFSNYSGEDSMDSQRDPAESAVPSDNNRHAQGNEKYHAKIGSNEKKVHWQQDRDNLHQQSVEQAEHRAKFSLGSRSRAVRQEHMTRNLNLQDPEALEFNVSLSIDFQSRANLTASSESEPVELYSFEDPSNLHSRFANSSRNTGWIDESSMSQAVEMETYP